MHECPNCGELMERQEDEPDVGIVGGWACHNCGHTELADEDESDLTTSTTWSIK
jgi:DNA-directed RNA polymerase subunit M/transcription elongation factor TFIIS